MTQRVHKDKSEVLWSHGSQTLSYEGKLLNRFLRIRMYRYTPSGFSFWLFLFYDPQIIVSATEIGSRDKSNLHQTGLMSRVYKLLWTFFISLGHIAKRRIAESCGQFLLIFWRNCQTLFQSGCILFYTPTSSVWRFCFLTPLPTLCLGVFYVWLFWVSCCIFG